MKQCCSVVPPGPLLCSAVEGLINSSKDWTPRLEAGKQTSRHLVEMAVLLRAAPTYAPPHPVPLRERAWRRREGQTAGTPLPLPAPPRGEDGREGPVSSLLVDRAGVPGGALSLASGCGYMHTLGKASVFPLPLPSVMGVAC